MAPQNAPSRTTLPILVAGRTSSLVIVGIEKEKTALKGSPTRLS